MPLLKIKITRPMAIDAPSRRSDDVVRGQLAVAMIALAVATMVFILAGISGMAKADHGVKAVSSMSLVDARGEE